MKAGPFLRQISLIFAAAFGLLGEPAFAQGPMGPGGGAMAPQPRVAPPPPPAAPPPVMAPAAPVMQPGSPASIAPRSAPAPAGSTTKSTDGTAATSQDRPTAPPGGSGFKATDNESPRPVDRIPTTTGGTPGRAAPVAAPVVPTVDRAMALTSVSRGLLPARDVAVVSTDGSGGARTQVRTNDKGQFSFGTLSPGVRDVSFAFADLKRALPGGGAGKRLPTLTVSLVVPATPGGGTRGNLVMHTYARVDPTKDIRTRITVPKDGSGTVIDWGDGTPPVNTVRDGWPVDVGNGRGPVDTIGKVSFVPKFQKMRMGFIQMDPCIPWWQCEPPPDPDPPPMDDPWTEILPEIDVLPPDDPIIDIVDIFDPPREDPPKDDPPRDDPPKVDPPRIGEKGTFDIGPLPEGVREVRLTLPGGLITDPPKPPVKVALLLPTEPRAAVEAMNAKGRPPRVSEADRLLLVEHIYAPDTTGQSIHVKIAMSKDGRTALVDWGDGTPVTDVRRDGKPVAAASVDREAIGRILFVGAKKKQP